MAMGGSITDTTQAVTRYIPSTSRADSHPGAPSRTPVSQIPNWSNRADSQADGPFAPATVSHSTTPSSSTISGIPAAREVSTLSACLWRRW